MSQAHRPVGDRMPDRSPSIRLDLVEKTNCEWAAHLTVDLPQGYHISVVLAEEKIIEASTEKPSGMTLTFQFGMSAESLSISVTDLDGETVLIDNGYLHVSNLWDRKYAHAEIRCETKRCRHCPCVVFMNNVGQLPN